VRHIGSNAKVALLARCAACMLAPACTSIAITQEAAFCAACCRGQICQRRLDLAQSNSQLRQVCKMLLTTKLRFRASWNTAQSHPQVHLATCVKLEGVKRPVQTPAQAKVLFTCTEKPVLCPTYVVDISFGIHNTACLASKLPAISTVGVSSFHTQVTLDNQARVDAHLLADQEH